MIYTRLEVKEGDRLANRHTREVVIIDKVKSRAHKIHSGWVPEITFRVIGNPRKAKEWGKVYVWGGYLLQEDWETAS